jgi:hypothetical protein
VPTHEIHKTYDDDKFPEQKRKHINQAIKTYLEHECDKTPAGKQKMNSSLKWLREISHHPVRNAFRNVSFGYHGVGNVNKACPGDIMHSNNEGTCHRVINALNTCHRLNSTKDLKAAKAKKKVKYKLAMKNKEDAIKKAKQAQKNKPGEQPGKCDEERVEVKITEALTEDEMSKFHVFSPEVRMQVDLMAKK